MGVSKNRGDPVLGLLHERLFWVHIRCPWVLGNSHVDVNFGLPWFLLSLWADRSCFQVKMTKLWCPKLNLAVFWFFLLGLGDFLGSYSLFASRAKRQQVKLKAPKGACSKFEGTKFEGTPQALM